MFFERRWKRPLDEMGVAGHICESNRLAREHSLLDGLFGCVLNLFKSLIESPNPKVADWHAACYEYTNDTGGEEVTPHGPLTPGLRQTYKLANDSMLAQDDDRASSWLCLPSSQLWPSP